MNMCAQGCYILRFLKNNMRSHVGDQYGGKHTGPTNIYFGDPILPPNQFEVTYKCLTYMES